MKKAATMLALLLSAAASAQKNIYLGADAGLGGSWATIHYPPDYAYAKPENMESVSMMAIDMYMGCSAGRWSFQWGIGILPDGYIRYMSYGGANSNYREIMYYPIITFPLIAGYELQLGKKWSLVPHAGFIIGQNQPATVHYDGGDYHMTSSDFNHAYHDQSILTTLDVEFRRYLGHRRRHSIFIAPRLDVMMTNMTKSYSSSLEHADLRLNNFTVNIGVSRYFALGGERKLKKKVY